jgi:ATP-dependent Clp protease ATP-binding subunit ClpC
LLADGEGVAAKVLENFDVDPSSLRNDVIRALGEVAGAIPGGGRSSGERQKSVTLDEFGRNLTQLAAEGKLDPIVGREKEIERVIQILGRRTKNNPVLVGEPGVGKTAIAEGLAQRITQNNVPELLSDKQVYSLDMGALVSGRASGVNLKNASKKLLKKSKPPEILFS